MFGFINVKNMFTKLMKIKNELVENKFLTLKIINH